jgi:hypothetical protein
MRSGTHSYTGLALEQMSAGIDDRHPSLGRGGSSTLDAGPALLKSSMRSRPHLAATAAAAGAPADCCSSAGPVHEWGFDPDPLTNDACKPLMDLTPPLCGCVFAGRLPISLPRPACRDSGTTSLSLRRALWLH